MDASSVDASQDVFCAGRFVLVTLAAPREKFWGVLLRITGAGVSVRGMDLNSYEEIARLLRSGEAATASSVFFPMHRVERIEADANSGELPSLAERFRDISGTEAALFLGGNIESTCKL